MNTTKTDLSYNIVRLDFMALLQTAQTAVRLAREEVYQEYNKTGDLFLKKPYDNFCSETLAANRLISASKRLSVALETYQALHAAAFNREELTIINRPELSHPMSHDTNNKYWDKESD